MTGWRILVLAALGLALLAPGAQAQKADAPLMMAPATPKPAVAGADEPKVEFLVGSQSLILRLPAGEVPKVLELRRPARVEVEFNGTGVASGGAAFATGVVSRYEVVHVGTRSRAILYLRTPLVARPAIQYLADRVVIAVVPKLAPSVQQILPSPSPEAFVSPKPHLTPVPTAAPATRPNVRITPVPVPSGKPPAHRDIPPISGLEVGA